MHMQGLSQVPQGAHHQAGGDDRRNPSTPQTPGHASDGDGADAPGRGAPGWEKELIPTPKSSLPASRL